MSDNDPMQVDTTTTTAAPDRLTKAVSLDESSDSMRTGNESGGDTTVAKDADKTNAMNVDASLECTKESALMNSVSEQDNNDDETMVSSDPSDGEIDQVMKEMDRKMAMVPMDDVLNIDKACDLLEASKKAGDKIEGKNVILLVGGTGSGKVRIRPALS